MRRFATILMIVFWTVGSAWAGYLEDGKAAAKEGDYNEAVEAFTTAIRSGLLLRLDLSAAFLLRGDAYQNLDDFDAALEDYERALRMRPDYALIFARRARAYYRMRHYELGHRRLGRGPAPETKGCLRLAGARAFASEGGIP